MKPAKFATLALLNVLPLVVYVTICSSETHRLHSHNHYVGKWCFEQNGELEKRLPDGTRVDCVTTTHAIEGEFAKSWKDGIGQAAHYAIMTGKKAGILLILEHQKSCRYLSSLKTVLSNLLIDNHPVRLWTTGPMSGKCSK